MLEIRYFLIIIAWVMLFIGFYYKNYVITVLGGVFIAILGIHLYRFGLLGVGTFLLTTLALVHVLIGSYVFIKGTWEQYKDY